MGTKRAGVPSVARILLREPVCKRQERKEVYRAHDVVEHEHVVKRIRCHKAQEHRLLRHRKLAGADNNKCYQDIERYIECKRREAARDKPVEELVVRAVKPLLLVPHARRVVGVKYVREVFLTPTHYRALHSTLDSHRPDREEAGVGCCILKRDRCEAAQGTTLWQEVCLAQCQEAANEYHHANQAP